MRAEKEQSSLVMPSVAAKEISTSSCNFAWIYKGGWTIGYLKICVFTVNMGIKFERVIEVEKLRWSMEYCQFVKSRSSEGKRQLSKWIRNSKFGIERVHSPG